MGLFDQLLGGLVGKLGTPDQKSSLLELASNVIRDHPDGLAGVVKQFQAGGLADQVKSWVGTGQNQPISADQLTNVLGQDNVAKMSQKLGLSPQIVSAGLAAVLPAIVDHLTPKGKIEPGADLQAGLKAAHTKLTT